MSYVYAPACHRLLFNSLSGGILYRAFRRDSRESFGQSSSPPVLLMLVHQTHRSCWSSSPSCLDRRWHLDFRGRFFKPTPTAQQLPRSSHGQCLGSREDTQGHAADISLSMVRGRLCSTLGGQMCLNLV